MRALSSASVVTVAAAASMLLAPTAYATPNGDNGTVKIHDAKTLEELKKNEPKVCSFYLDAFFFDGQQKVSWKIVEMPPTGDKGKVAETGNLTLNADGHERTEDLSLKDGHYKLYWTFDGQQSNAAKHKVFWVDCDGVPEVEVTASTVPSPSVPAENTPEPEGSTEPSPVPTSSAPGGVEPSVAPSPNGGGDLAETGSSIPAGALAAAAASMLGAGTYLVLRRRNSRSPQG